LLDIMSVHIDAQMVGGASGAAVGATLGALLGGRKVAACATACAAMGAAVGIACGRALEKRLRKPQEEVEEEPMRTFADVAREDAEFQAAAAEEVVDYNIEADVLRSLFIGQRSAQLVSVCEALNATAKLEEARATFQPWATATPSLLGAAIEAVVEGLEAPHLRPSGIARRMECGVAASCFGLFTLLAQPAFDTE
jgi:Na+/glutamate symporter